MAKRVYGTDYTNFQDELGNISRRRGMADMLRQRGLQSGQNLGQTQMAGGYAIENKGGAELNSIIQQLLGAWQQKKLGKEEDEVKEQQREDMKTWALALETAGQTGDPSHMSELQPIQMPTSGIDYSRLGDESKAKIDSLNKGAQGMIDKEMRELAISNPLLDEAGMPTQDENKMMEHLLSGLDRGGYAEQIASTQLVSQLAPQKLNTTGLPPGLRRHPTTGEVTDSTGKVYSVNALQAMKESVARAGSGVQGYKGLATIEENLRRTHGNLTDPQIRELALEEQRRFASDPTGATPTESFTPRQLAEGEEYTSEFSKKFIINGQLTQNAKRFLGISQDGKVSATSIINQNMQDEMTNAEYTNLQIIEDSEFLKELLDNNQMMVGLLAGSVAGINIQKMAVDFGLSESKVYEGIQTLRRIQTTKKIEMIGQAGGVKAFDSELEMLSLFESLATEKMNIPAIIAALDKMAETSRRNLRNAAEVRSFLYDADMPFLNEGVTIPEPYIMQRSRSPKQVISSRPAQDGSGRTEVLYDDGTKGYQ